LFIPSSKSRSKKRKVQLLFRVRSFGSRLPRRGGGGISKSHDIMRERKKAKPSLTISGPLGKKDRGGNGTEKKGEICSLGRRKKRIKVQEVNSRDK